MPCADEDAGGWLRSWKQNTTSAAPQQTQWVWFCGVCLLVSPVTEDRRTCVAFPNVLTPECFSFVLWPTTEMLSLLWKVMAMSVASDKGRYPSVMWNENYFKQELNGRPLPKWKWRRGGRRKLSGVRTFRNDAPTLRNKWPCRHTPQNKRPCVLPAAAEIKSCFQLRTRRQTTPTCPNVSIMCCCQTCLTPGGLQRS